MTTHTADTTTLNTLIATLLDSIDGYTKSAQDVKDRDLADRFNARARERQSPSIFPTGSAPSTANAFGCAAS